MNIKISEESNLNIFAKKKKGTDRVIYLKLYLFKNGKNVLTKK